MVAIAGAAAVAASVLLVGGAPRWAQAIVALLIAVAVVVQTRSRRGLARMPPLIAVLAAAFALTALQLVPLPRGLLEMLQPIGSSLRDDGAAVMGTSPWPSLSLDPAGSLRALCMLSTLLGAAWIALRISVSERGRYRILSAVAVVGGLTALVVWVHVLVGAERLYGIYQPEHARPRFLGPLLNDNHLGGFMAFCATVAAGLAMYTRQRSILRVTWTLVVTLCGATAVAGTSRGATLSLIGGLGLAGVNLIGQRFFAGEGARSRRKTFTTSLPIVVVAACTIFVIVYASAGDVSTQIARTTIDEVHAPNSKFAIWRSAAQLVDESPVLGVGRGAFEVAITRVHPAAAMWSFSHAENEYVQAIVDWGIGGGFVLVLLAAWLTTSALRRWRDGPLAAGALAAVAAIALQSSVDFGVEILGLALPVVVVLATLTYVPLKELEGRRVTISSGARGAFALALVVGAVLLLGTSTRSVAEDHERMTQDSSSLADALDSIERHPLDYFGYARAARLLMASDRPEGVRALNHALRLNPLHPGLHHLAARMLVRAKRTTQAAVEYAAVLRTTATPAPIVAEVIARLPPEDAAAAIPADVPNLTTMIRLLDDPTESAVAIRWLTRVLAERPNNTQACDELFRIATQRQDLAAATVAGERCADAASRERRVSLGQLLVARGRFAEARRTVHDVEVWTGVVDEKIAGWLVACDALAGEQRWDEAKRCLRKLDITAITPEKRPEITSRLDKIETALRAVLPP